MACPHLKEVVMLFCQAYPVKKMVPLDRLATADPCLSGQFEQCPLYREFAARMRGESPGELAPLCVPVDARARRGGAS